MKFGTRVEVAERMTAEEFLELAPEDRKAELIDGVMIMPSPALDIHERLFGFLFRLISEYVEMYDLGEVRGSRTPVVLASDQVYEPDILFVARERAGRITERGVMGAPDLVVEILSRATVAYDRGPKLQGYERAGVREVWLIDPYGPVGTEFYRLEGGRFVPARVEGGVLRSAAIPGLALRVEWLWPEGRFIPIREALAWIEAQGGPSVAA
jgi:Uncharacterized protein conserved in cyanobacteria